MRHALVIGLTLLLASVARAAEDPTDVELDLAALATELPETGVVVDPDPSPVVLDAETGAGVGLAASVGSEALDAEVTAPTLPSPPLPLPALPFATNGARLRVTLPHAIDVTKARAASHGIEPSWVAPPGDPITAAMSAPNAAAIRNAAGEAEEGAQDVPVLPVLPFAPPPTGGTLPTDLALGATLLILLLSSLYSRFQRHTLLLSTARASIHAAIVASPGITVAEIAAVTRLSRGALVHHLHMLEKHGMITSRNDGSHRRLYPPGGASAPQKPPTGKEQRILVILREEGPLTQAELARRLGVSRQAVHLQVKRLQRSRRLIPVTTNGGTLWRASEESEDAGSPANDRVKAHAGSRTSADGRI